MDEIFKIAEQEMLDLKQPYVGSEHILLAYLKKYNNKYLSYDRFKSYIEEIIGNSYKKSEYILYTPIVRNLKNEVSDIKECLKRILSDTDSIAYNILLSKNENIEKIIAEIENTNS